ncbi:DUF29 domain-containing protein [Nodosilinea sp. LEGE 07088]|uniref:DUF29 domain-containing protein n=1 Tax=Nodosilinea sp. LEGE 07088 TaxID=2777968 RepID=UPI0018827BF2|nr:DUF29 domain-containing protein [Nodosilinea sp. LEGE 07088]MBE9139384.1 DUF29 domain-containing protein [Nodosilinea sp. LEGE 07088]
MNPKIKPPQAMASSASLYDADFQLWIDKTVTLLKTHDFENLDLENLIEEIDSLGKSDNRAILSNLMRLCEHLIKIKYWHAEREDCLRGWTLEVKNFRRQIRNLLKDSPSLKGYLAENVLTEYQDGRENVLIASGLGSALIPEVPFLSLEQALAEDWLPTFSDSDP